MPLFDRLRRGVFWLLIIVVAAVVLIIVMITASCTVGVLIGRIELGTCTKIGLTQIIHDWWAELLTAIAGVVVMGGGRSPPAA